MEQQTEKRLKPMTGPIVNDITSSFNDMVKALNSICNSYGNILNTNRRVVMHLQNIKEREEAILEQTMTNLSLRSTRE